MSRTAIDTSSQAFAARLASLARAARRDRDISVRAIARSTGGAVSARQLRAVEAEQADLAAVDIAAITEAYGIDLESLLGARVSIDVDASTGVLSTAGITRAVTPGDEDALLIGYLRLVRELRDQPHEPTVPLRRDDIELLARQLGKDAALVLDRLGQLMGATVTQRRSMVALFATGAALVILSTSATAIEPAMFTGSDDQDASRGVVASAPQDDEAGPDRRADLNTRAFAGTAGTDTAPTVPADALSSSSPSSGDPVGAGPSDTGAPGSSGSGQDGPDASLGSGTSEGPGTPDSNGESGPGSDGSSDTPSSSPERGGASTPDLDVRVDAPGDGGPIEAPADELPAGGPTTSPTPINSPGTPSDDAGVESTNPGTSPASGNTGTDGGGIPDDDTPGGSTPSDSDPGSDSTGDSTQGDSDPGSDSTGDSTDGVDAPGGTKPGGETPPSGDTESNPGASGETPPSGGAGNDTGSDTGAGDDIDVVDVPEDPGSQVPDNPRDDTPDTPADPPGPDSAPGDSPQQPADADPPGPDSAPGDAPQQPPDAASGAPNDDNPPGTSPGNSNNAGNSGAVGQPGNSGNSQAGGGTAGGGGASGHAGP